jgi:hypothetical protein
MLGRIPLHLLVQQPEQSVGVLTFDASNDRYTSAAAVILEDICNGNSYFCGVQWQTNGSTVSSKRIGSWNSVALKTGDETSLKQWSTAARGAGWH